MQLKISIFVTSGILNNMQKNTGVSTLIRNYRLLENNKQSKLPSKDLLQLTAKTINWIT